MMRLAIENVTQASKTTVTTEMAPTQIYGEENKTHGQSSKRRGDTARFAAPL